MQWIAICQRTKKTSRNIPAYSYNVLSWNKTVKKITETLSTESSAFALELCTHSYFLFSFFYDLFSTYTAGFVEITKELKLFNSSKHLKFPSTLQKEKTTSLSFHTVIFNNIYAFIIKAVESLLI